LFGDEDYADFVNVDWTSPQLNQHESQEAGTVIQESNPWIIHRQETREEKDDLPLDKTRDEDVPLEIVGVGSRFLPRSGDSYVSDQRCQDYALLRAQFDEELDKELLSEANTALLISNTAARTLSAVQEGKLPEYIQTIMDPYDRDESNLNVREDTEAYEEYRLNRPLAAAKDLWTINEGDDEPASSSPREFGIPVFSNFDGHHSIIQPETRPISQEQLVAEVNGIYAGLVMVENSCVEFDKQAPVPQSDLNIEGRWVQFQRRSRKRAQGEKQRHHRSSSEGFRRLGAGAVGATLLWSATESSEKDRQRKRRKMSRNGDDLSTSSPKPPSDPRPFRSSVSSSLCNNFRIRDGHADGSSIYSYSSLRVEDIINSDISIGSSRNSAHTWHSTRRNAAEEDLDLASFLEFRNCSILDHTSGCPDLIDGMEGSSPHSLSCQSLMSSRLVFPSSSSENEDVSVAVNRWLLEEDSVALYLPSPASDSTVDIGTKDPLLEFHGAKDPYTGGLPDFVLFPNPDIPHPFPDDFASRDQLFTKEGNCIDAGFLSKKTSKAKDCGHRSVAGRREERLLWLWCWLSELDLDGDLLSIESPVTPDGAVDALREELNGLFWSSDFASDIDASRQSTQSLLLDPSGGSSPFRLDPIPTADPEHLICLDHLETLDCWSSLFRGLEIDYHTGSRASGLDLSNLRMDEESNQSFPNTNILLTMEDLSMFAPTSQSPYRSVEMQDAFHCPETSTAITETSSPIPGSSTSPQSNPGEGVAHICSVCNETFPRPCDLR
jgi:hypothetical protein